MGWLLRRQLDVLRLPFNFQLLGVDWDAQSIRRSVDSLESALPKGAWPNYVLGNHDEMRLASRLGPQGARQAALLLLTLRGTPTLYYGDEIGMLEAVIPPEKQQDPWGLPRPRTGQGWLPHADAVGRFAQRGFLTQGVDTLAAAQRRLHPGKRHKPAQPASLPAKSLPQPAEATKSLPRLAGRRIPSFAARAQPIVSLIYASCQARRRSWLRSIFRRASTRWNIPACAQVKSSSQRRWIATGLWAKSGCACAPKKAFWSGSR